MRVERTLPNTRYGIELNDSQNTIGGSGVGQRNIISGNLQGGVLIWALQILPQTYL